jgi:hypothetical protein
MTARWPSYRTRLIQKYGSDGAQKIAAALRNRARAIPIPSLQELLDAEGDLLTTKTPSLSLGRRPYGARASREKIMTPEPYEPFSSNGTFVPAKPEQYEHFTNFFKQRYASVKACADAITELERQIKETEAELAASVEIERQVEHVLKTAFPKPTFMDQWRATRSNQ